MSRKPPATLRRNHVPTRSFRTQTALGSTASLIKGYVPPPRRPVQDVSPGFPLRGQTSPNAESRPPKVPGTFRSNGDAGESSCSNYITVGEAIKKGPREEKSHFSIAPPTVTVRDYSTSEGWGVCQPPSCLQCFDS